MRKLWVVLVVLANTCALNLHAQDRGTIEVIIHNSSLQVLPSATVELLKATDSSLVKASVADAKGLAVFENIIFGNYLLRVTETNHQAYYTAVFDFNKTPYRLPDIQMTAQSREMTGITVTARKPFIQKLSDRIVVNVESSILSTGSSAFEVLERSPGVNIDPNDIISLRGRSGVNVMIDGKITAMSGQDLVNYLRSLPSSAIDRIEIITNPSSKYDAAGNSGIIDIRLKKINALEQTARSLRVMDRVYIPKPTPAPASITEIKP
ncbi:MAG: TonB-dependent receptor [Chitinophagaceae bacterium]|nr:TonB-dependent receptor [Chitinophagaceae bacterium]